MEEIWKPVVGYEELYEVSNLGRIKSLPCKPGKGVNYRYRISRIRKQNVSNGYYGLSLNKDGKETRKLVHRLVLQAFNSTTEKPESNHKDGNKLNNRLDNLEWVTSKENKKHAFATGLCNHRRGEKLYNSKLTDIQVKEIKLLSKTQTQKSIAELYNVGRCCISHIITGRNWKHIIGG